MNNDMHALACWKRSRLVARGAHLLAQGQYGVAVDDSVHPAASQSGYVVAPWLVAPLALAHVAAPLSAGAPVNTDELSYAEWGE
jgi:hypothetical protein